MSVAPAGPGGAGPVGWLAGTLAVAAGGYLLGLSPAWEVPPPLHAELAWPLSWIAEHGPWLGVGLLTLGAWTILDGVRGVSTWTRGRTALTVTSLLGVTLVVACQGQSLWLTPPRAPDAAPQPTPTPQGNAPTPLPRPEPTPDLVPLEELLPELDSRNGPKNLAVVDALIQHGHAAEPALRDYLRDASKPGRPYAVYALAQILHRHGAVEDGLVTLLSCLDPRMPEVHAQAATGLTLLADPRTVESMVAHYRRGEWGLAEALHAISGERFADQAQAGAWFLANRERLPAQLHGRSRSDDAAEAAVDQLTVLLGLLHDSGADMENVEVVGELRRLGEVAIPGLIELAERRVDGSGWAAHALARVLLDLPLEQRPEGALEVLVSCVNTEADYFLQAQALEGLYELADRRTVQALLAHLDHPRSAVRLLCRSLCERLTGESFPTRAAAEAWWAEHGEELGPQVGVSR